MRGLMAPGHEIVGLGDTERPIVLSGSSAAAAFVSATIALLWALFPSVSDVQLRYALTAHRIRRTHVPPMLDAVHAHSHLTTFVGEGKVDDRAELAGR